MTWTINHKLLPVKAHYFFFMAAKPGFGALSDRFPRHRHQIFLVSVIGQSVALAALGVVPAADPENVYQSTAFWSFVLLMCIGNVCFNVANSLSDAICFEVLGAGNELQYGQQRAWGCFGWGGAALISGASMSWWGQPALFLVFAALIGVLDGFLIYYLLWYLEDLAGMGNAESYSVNIKLLEGLVVAAQTLGGEVLFFPISGWILKRLGHSYCLTLVFSVYSVRLMLLSVAPGPWCLLPIELFLQGPTYALGYSTIVAYASAVAPEGTQATVQGIAAGVDDSLALSCCLAHLALQSALRSSQATKPEVARESPEPTNVTLLDARKPSVTPKITESVNLKTM
ncbi:hypothetical protein B566_EDAN009506 [Ephemera danica]|nr:hypothetical protein B566_EDAN009506 [Ephemera danica]